MRVVCLLALALQTVLPAVHPEHGARGAWCDSSRDGVDLAGAPAAASSHDAVACPVCAAARTGTAGIVDGLRAWSIPGLASLAAPGPASAPASAAVRGAHPPRAPPLRS